MKKLILLFSFIFLSLSCSNNDDYVDYSLEYVPVTTITIPDSFEFGVAGQIKIKYNVKTSCHGFNGYYYAKDNFTRTIAVNNYVLEKNDCSTLTNVEKEVIINFKPDNTGTYTFKFWKGKDASGNNIFEEIVRDVI